MHALAHSLAHRAPTATRPRVRWQPYNPLSSQATSSSLSTRSPSSTQISTPATSISSPPSNTPLPEPKHSHALQNQKEPPQPRDNSKKQFAAALADQAVKTLGEIWRPQDIPRAFLTTPRSHEQTKGLVPAPASSPSGSAGGSDIRHIVPIKGFVHEVLRRSRTSGCVLQTALCYLEAIRPRIPGLLRKEQSGQGSHNETDISSRVLPATELELKLEEQYRQQELCNPETPFAPPPDYVSTVRMTDVSGTDGLASASSGPLSSSSLIASSDPIASQSPPLPSPLLCPRRTFLASLILASKFTQDKCYSNRAWAKLSGLPAKEISRCERALGEALDWRLWVGKSPVPNSQPTASTSASPASRPVVRCQSESNLLNTPASRSPFLARQDSRPLVQLPHTNRLLQRSSTMPAEVFANQSSNLNGRMLYKNYQPFETASQSMCPPKKIPVAVSYCEGQSSSPSSDNPGLSYSPSSTESSPGERTIQMSTFIDEPTVMYSARQARPATDFWSGSDNDDQNLRISPQSHTQVKKPGKAPVARDAFGPGALPPVIGGPDLMVLEHVVPSSNPSWLLEGEAIRPVPLGCQ